MLFSVIQKDSYQDSVNLMLLSSQLSKKEGVHQVSVMMGTPANKDIFRNSNLYTADLDEASANDICILIDSEESSIVEEIVKDVHDFLKNQSVESTGDRLLTARTWDSAFKKLPDANMALISVPGVYVGKKKGKE